jgi:hypothetical protein
LEKIERGSGSRLRLWWIANANLPYSFMPMDFEVRNEPQRADFCFTIGSGESSVSAERLKNGACDNGFKVGYFASGG